jgi:tRNA(adenine34) deaminase
MTPQESLSEPNHEHWMALALKQADLAAGEGEVPVGAVLVDNGKLLAEGYNQPIGSSDPTAHAEIVVMRAAAHIAGNYRLPGSTLYVTIEPCTMCVGALVHARIGSVVFGAREPRAGAVVSQYHLLDGSVYNHRPEYVEGVLAAQCAARLQDFFRARRQ